MLEHFNGVCVGHTIHEFIHSYYECMDADIHEYALTKQGAVDRESQARTHHLEWKVSDIHALLLGPLRIEH